VRLNTLLNRTNRGDSATREPGTHWMLSTTGVFSMNGSHWRLGRLLLLNP